MNLPHHDIAILMGFAAIVGKQNDLPSYLGFTQKVACFKISSKQNCELFLSKNMYFIFDI